MAARVAQPGAALLVVLVAGDVDDGAELGERGEAVTFPAVDQYALQGDRFAEAVRGVGEVPVPLEDAVANMAVIDAIVRSTETDRWEAVAR